MPNTQCSNAQSGFPLDQDNNIYPTDDSDGAVDIPDAATDSTVDAGEADARQGADASVDAGGGG
jgi:hypothetical protein